MNNKIKMALDVVMTVLFICLMKISFTGVALHEIIGISIFVFFIIHQLLNYKWIASMCNNIFAGKVKGKAKFMFVLNAVLFILTSFTVISGILISQSLFPEVSTNNTAIWSELHHFAAYSSLILLSVHIGLHWSMIMNFFKKAFRMKNDNGTRTWLSRVIALALAVVGVRALLNQSIQSNFTAPFVNESENIVLYSNTKTKDSDENPSSITQSTTNGLVVDTPTLDDYLSKLFCSGCHRRCPLTNLQCGRGNSYKQEAVTEYNEKYSQSDTSSSSSDNEAISNEATSTASNNKKATPADYIGIMSLVIAGTHYTVSLPKKLK